MLKGIACCSGGMTIPGKSPSKSTRGTLKGLQPPLESDERPFLLAFDEFRKKLVEIAKSRDVRGPQNR